MQQMVSQHGGMTIGQGLTFPIKLRCGKVADLCAEPGLEDALARALGRAFATAQAALPAALAVGQGVVLKPPRIANAGQLDARDADQVLARVRRAIDAAAHARSLPLGLPPPAERRPAAMFRRAAPTRAAMPEVSERFDPERFEPKGATYEIPSYDGGKTKAKVAAKKDPLERLREVYAQLLSLFDSFIDEQTKFGFPDASREKAIKALKDDRAGWADEADLAELIGRLPKVIAQREQVAQSTMLLLTLVRPRVAELNRAAAASAARRLQEEVRAVVHFESSNEPSDEDFIREVNIQLGDIYLALPALYVPVGDKAVKHVYTASEDPFDLWFKAHNDALTDAFERFYFLSDYYKDSKVLLGVAAMRFAGYRLARIWTDLGKVRPPGDIDQPAWPALGDKPPKFGDILQYARPGPRPSDQLLRIAEATGYAAILHKFFSQGSALPARLSEVSGAAKPDDIRMMSALLYHLQVMLIVLGLWQNVPTVWKVVDQVPGITKTLTGGDLGGKWTVATYKLEDEFNKELAIENWRHPNIKTQVDDWTQRITNLFDEVKTAARNTALTKAAITLVFSLVLTFGVSLWLNVVLQGSKLLLVLAEGVALTAINTGLAVMQGQSVTVKGLALEFGLNTALVGLGPLLKSFRSIAAIEEQLARSRPLLTALGKGAGMIAVTTAGQLGIAKLLDDQAQKAGGETSTTEMLTINLIFNTLAMLAGAALHRFDAPKGAPPLDAKALVLKLKTDANVVVTETSAQKLLDLAPQIASFQKATAELQTAARAGILTEHQYKLWQGRGELLLIELDIPELGQLFGVEIAPSEMKAMLEGMAKILRRPFSAQVVLALPEFSGLKRLGEGVSWTYDPTHPPEAKRLEALKARFAAERGVTVRELPGGGWEAVDSEGVTRIQVLPAGPQIAGLLEPPLRDMVAGGRAQSAADLIDAQSAAPELGSVMKDLARGSGKTSAQKILEAIGRPGAGALGLADESVWRGLSNYLRQGGDPARLAQLLTFREGNFSAEANNRYARRVLALMDGRAPADFPKTAKLLSFTGKATQEGLSNAQQQPFVAELEALLEDAASKNADAVKDLLPTLRFLSDSSSTPWLGLRNYLAKGGSVRVLNTALGFRGEGVSQFRPDLVGQAMEMMKDWSPQAVRGLEALERLNATARGKGRKYANLFLLRSEDPKGVAAALESLAILEPKIDTKDPASLTGVRKVLGALSAEDAPMQVEKLPSGQTISKPAPLGSAPNITGAVGALRAGAALSGQFASPDVFIRFEVPHEVINEATGEVLGRAYDIEVLQRHAATGKGLPPPDTVLRRAEVKEVSSAKSLSTPRVLKEFATDILHDIQLRTAALNAGQPAPGPLQDTVWMIRDADIRATATQTVRSAQSDPVQNFDLLDPAEKEDMVKAEMRRMVKKALEPALKDSSLAGQPLHPYEAALNDPKLPFVVFF